MLSIISLFLLGFLAVSFFAYGVEPGRNLKETPSFLKERTTRYMDIGDTRLHYLKQGAGRPVILLHGGGTWLYSFRKNIDELAREHTVYALDMPGHGFTTYQDPATLTLAGFATLLKDFLAKQGIVQADFIGSSWGGGWALYFAEVYPDEVGRIVLIDATGTAEIAAHDGSSWKYLSYPLVGELLVHFFSFGNVRKDIHENLFSNPSAVSDAEIRQIYIPITYSRNLKAQYILQRTLNWSEVDRHLEKVHNETLVIWGKDDRYIPIKFGQNLEARLPNARFVSIENAGHLPHEEQPERVNALLLKFLQ